MLSLIGSCHHIFSINASLTFNISGIKRIVTSQEDATSITETFPLVIYAIDFFVEILLSNSFSGIGEARIFQRGGHIVSKWGYSFIWTFSSWNVIAFSPPVLGFLVKEGLQMGGRGHPRTPCLRPWVAVLWCKRDICLLKQGLQSTNVDLQTTYEKHRSQVRIHWGSRDHWPVVSGLRITSRLNA